LNWGASIRPRSQTTTASVHSEKRPQRLGVRESQSPGTFRTTSRNKSATTRDRHRGVGPIRLFDADQRRGSGCSRRQKAKELQRAIGAATPKSDPQCHAPSRTSVCIPPSNINPKIPIRPPSRISQVLCQPLQLPAETQNSARSMPDCLHIQKEVLLQADRSTPRA